MNPTRVRRNLSHPVRTIAAILGALVLVAWAPAALADGAAAYKSHCQNCHGADGQSDTPVGKAMKVPHLAGAAPSLETVTATVRENPKHKSISSKVSDDDLAAITEFLKTL
jgi:mono/diheme cytochrome c family protein